MHESVEAKLKARISNLEGFVERTASSKNDAELLEVRMAEEHLKILRYELELLEENES